LFGHSGEARFYFPHLVVKGSNVALRAVPDHPKFAHLKSLLKLPKGAVLGYLECVWHFAGRFTPQGNIGKYSDLAIESWTEWDGDEGKLIDSLVKSGWLDIDDEFRLIVHDWSKNADELVHTTLARSCLPFADGAVPSSRRLNSSERARFNEWLKENGVDPKPTGRPQMQPKCRESADSLHLSPEKAPGNAAEMTKPAPAPAPAPEPEGEAPPELPPDMPMLNYARWLLEERNIPVTFQNQQSAAAAIEAYAREHELPPNKAAPALAELARDALERGERVERWWFDDAKWRNGHGGRAGPKEPCPVVESKDSKETTAWFAAKAREKRAAGKPLTEIERNLLAADA
jgi:hypothetical protein